jgi:hypothetical protein
MIERVERKAPLSVRPAAALPVRYEPPAAPAAGSVLELPLGEIAGDFRAMGTRKGHHAAYELLVANDTPRPVATFAYAAEQTSRAKITWNAILVPPYSAIAVEIDVELPRRGRSPRVLAELHAEDAKLTLDAGPPAGFSRGVARRATLLLSALLLLALGGVSIAKTEGHVLALAAPDTVRGGAPFTVVYALNDSAGAEYTVDTADGLQVARGTLANRSGAFALSLPMKRVSTGYDVRVFAHGRFGTDVRTAHVVALASDTPAKNTAALGVKGLSLANDTVRGGDPIVVNYTTSATVGWVRLIDEIGTVRAEALLNPHGRSMLEAPFVDADQDLRVVVDAQAGTARAEAEVPVRVLHADPTLATTADGRPLAAVPALAPDGSDGSANASGGASYGNAAPTDPLPAADDGGIISVSPLQHKGSPIVVRIARHEAGLRVAIMGDSGEELEGDDVGEGDASIVLPALDGPQPTRLSVVATYAKGYGQETFIRPITLR